MAFEFDTIFNQDYLYFYETLLTPERTQVDVERITTLLHMQPGAQVLDVPCGHGRIANALAEEGMQVTGVDSSELFLAQAQADAQRRGVRVRYLNGDMRKIPLEANDFDLVLNWFTSFGYFDDEENRTTLYEFYRLTKPGGVMLLDLMNRDRAASNRGSSIWERGDDLMIDTPAYDPITSRIETDRIHVRDGKVSRGHFSVQLFSAPEIHDWLFQTGFREVLITDPDGEPYQVDSRRMLVRAIK